MVLNRLYDNQRDCHRAINENRYNASVVNKRNETIKDNISKITHINGEPCKVLGVLGDDVLEVIYPWSKYIQWVWVIYVDITLSK